MSIGDYQITIQTWTLQFHTWSSLGFHNISIGQNFMYNPHRLTFETQTTFHLSIILILSFNHKWSSIEIVVACPTCGVVTSPNWKNNTWWHQTCVNLQLKINIESWQRYPNWARWSPSWRHFPTSNHLSQ